MPPIKLRYLLLLTLCYSAAPAHAARVVDLYRSMTPVVDQSPGARAAAFNEILYRVMIKATGQSWIPAERLPPSLRVADMVEQYGYENRSASADAPRQLYLWAKLQPQSVKRLIRQAGMPLWPEERPTTLIWLALEDVAGERRVLSAGEPHPVIDGLHEMAQWRGLPVILPLMDLQESSAVKFDTIATMQLETLQATSEKYASRYILVGHLQNWQDDLWRARWQLLGDTAPPVTTPDGALADILAAGVNPLASRIAQQFASYLQFGGEQYVDLIIDDISGAADYAHSLHYLQSLSLVSRVDVVGMVDSHINFRLHTGADMASVLQVISLGQVLYPRDAIDRLVFGLRP